MNASTATQSNELISLVEESGLTPETSDFLKNSFLPFFEQAKEWRQKASELVVTDESQKDLMKAAREARLALKEIRVNADKTRKALKEDSLRYGKAVQGMYNIIEYLIAPTEDHLQKQEDFIKIQHEKKVAQLREDRKAELEPYRDYVPFGIDLGVMSGDDYDKLLTGAKLQHDAKIEAARKAEADRIERERQEAEERERIRIENERLKKEAEEMEAKMRAEKEKAEAERKEAEKKAAEERAKADAERKAAEEKARKEREAIEAKLKAEKEQREKLEAEQRRKEMEEAKAKAEAEAKAKAEEKARIAAEKKAAAAPDREKIKAFGESLLAMVAQRPVLKTAEAEAMLNDHAIQIAGAIRVMIQQSESI